ncbi:MAG: cobalt-precorrin-6A reductase [Rhodospirillaceae bacterium]|nr:cobalt-precorrin-6A reductase [Rhodospirillaceae bacterium]
MPKILILGGTTESAVLAKYLAADDGFVTITSLAGRTRNPATVNGAMRQGGFGGIGGFVDYLLAVNIDAVVDATHPFAEQISNNAVDACIQTKTPLIRLTRVPWVANSDDHWTDVSSVIEAAESLPLNARTFVTTGRQELAPFLSRRDLWNLVRVIDPLDEIIEPSQGVVITGRGPFSVKHEIAIFRKYKINWLVSKNSGGAASYAKIEAARSLAIPVMMVGRAGPTHRPVNECETIEQVFAWLEKLFN